MKIRVDQNRIMPTNFCRSPVYFDEKISRRSSSSENQTPLSPKPTYKAFPSHTQVSDLGKILGLVNKYTKNLGLVNKYTQ